ncbi:hypothetical protein KI387_027918 [Taxus chinensis]|uniref:NB-ARC domain-containing protein n=1 Tax=Taxus chinensis TaxID=29808 RepID=A0AA38G0Q7_TAXCH|nr:hypothetical protein KI387_027918 [Taxus chinensis]
MGNSCGRCLGNSCACCCVNPSDQPADSHSHPEVESQQPADSPPHQSLESDSTLLLESIKRSIEETDPMQQRQLLISSIQNQLQMIKAKSQPSTSSSSSSSSGIHLESVGSAIKLGAEVIDTISQEAEKFSKTGMAKEMGNVVLRSVKGIAQTHWIFVGLSVVAFVLETCVKARSNVSECIELLEEIVQLAQDLNDLKRAMPAKSDKLLKAIHVIVESAVMCCDYIQKGRLSRYWSATTMEKQLEKIRQSIRDIQTSLTLTIGTNTYNSVSKMEKQLTRRSEQSPMKLLDFQPVGIERQVEEVKELLDMEGSEAAVAVVLCGFGGVGKSILAASVIQKLNWNSASFKFCRVMIDEKAADKRSHIIKIQKDIISDFGGGKVDLRDPAEGQNQIKDVIQNKCCLLFIDNVVDNDYIKDLLPRELLASDKTDSTMQKLRMLITSRAANLKPLLNLKKCHEYHVNTLSGEAPKVLLRNTILQGETEFYHHFDEAGFVNEVAEACRGVPLLLSVFGNHLRVEREERSYQEALEALRKGDPDSFADEGRIGEKVWYVYHNVRDEETREAFLDICTYFHGQDWNNVGHIFGENTLKNLRMRMLISRSDKGNQVIVHDILRLKGRKEGKDTRITNSKQFLRVLEDESKLENVKGLSLTNRRSLITLESRHLNAMRNSLRILDLGNWVNFDGDACDRSFKNLRFLKLGDLAVFPFADASKLEKLAVFHNRSKPGMCLPQLPRTLKVIFHQVPELDCEAFENLPLQNLRLLEEFKVRSLNPVKLPQGLKFPPSLKILQLSKCKQLPESFSHLTALVSLDLDYCDMESLPPGFAHLAKLKEVSMKYCRWLTSLPERFGSLRSLTRLSLNGCTRLEKLAADFGMLSSLEELSMRNCKNLKELPEDMSGLTSLQQLDLEECIKLERLPESFGTLSMQTLTLHSLDSLNELPQSFGKLRCLTKLYVMNCKSLVCLPDSFVELAMLKTLTIERCRKLCGLPKDFGRLSSLEEMVVEDCQSIKELPQGFGALPALKILRLENCSALVKFVVGFGQLACLEELGLHNLLLSCFPDDLGNLKRLNDLRVSWCTRLKTLPHDFENMVSLKKVTFVRNVTV